MAEERRYPKGMNAFKPHDKAPDFIITTLSINRETFMEWLSKETDEYVKLNVLKYQDGSKHNVQVNEYKKEG